MAEVNVYLQDLLIGLTVISWLVWHRVRRKPFLKPALFFPIMLFFLTALLSLLVNFFNFSSREILVASLYLLRWIFYAGIYLVVYDLVFYRFIKTSTIKTSLILMGAAAAVFGLVQYFIYPDLGNLAYLGWDPHKYRVFGTFFDPAFLGLILVLSLILLYKNFWAPRMAAAILFITCYLALALTYSRSSYLAFIAGMGVISWLKNSPKIFLFSFLLILGTLVLLPRPAGSEGVKMEREESIFGRIKNWQESLIIFKDKPVFGVGFDTYRYVQKNHGFISLNNWQVSHSGAGADSSLLLVLATTGILGFLAYVYLLYRIYRSFKKEVVILACLGAVLIHAWFSNSLFYPWIMLWLWILVGASLPTADS